MARMKTGRMTAKMGGPGDGIVVTSKKETVSPRQLTKREAQFNTDVSAGEKYKSDLGSYNKNIKTYNESKTDSRSFANFGGGPVDVSAEGLKQYNSTQGDGLKATRIQRPKAGGSEADYFKRISKDNSSYIGHVDYEKPTAPIKPKTPNYNDIPMDRMPMLKVTGVKTKQSMAKGKEVAPKGDFVNPDKKVGSNAPSMNAFAGGAKTKGSGKRYVKQVINSIGGPNNRGYNKEERLFKAKSSTGASGQDFTDLSSKDIKGIRKDYLKKDLSAARTDATLKPDERAKKIASAKMEIKQSRKAQNYSRKAEKGNLNYFTPGYNEGKNKNEVPRAKSRIDEYKNSQDNVNNRNTIDAKLKAIGEKSKPGSFGVMPTS